MVGIICVLEKLDDMIKQVLHEYNKEILLYDITIIVK